MHVDVNAIVKAQFVREIKENRTSFSVRFFDKDDQKIMSAVFSKMYDDNMNLKQSRLDFYESIFQKYGSKETIYF